MRDESRADPCNFFMSIVRISSRDISWGLKMSISRRSDGTEIKLAVVVCRLLSGLALGAPIDAAEIDDARFRDNSGCEGGIEAIEQGEVGYRYPKRKVGRGVEGGKEDIPII